MTLFEKHQEAYGNSLVLGQVGEATLEIIKKGDECQLMVRQWLDTSDPEEREMLRPVASEAIKERRLGNKQLQQLADLLETQFGISA